MQICLRRLLTHTPIWHEARSLLTLQQSNYPLNSALKGSAVKPLFVVFGWLGSTPRRLRRILEWYDQQGADVLWYIPPFHSMYVRYIELLRVYHVISVVPSVARHDARSVVEQLAAHQRPFSVHMFSGNGVHAFAHMTDFMSRNPNYEHAQSVSKLLRGVVIDSAPPYGNIELVVARSITSMLVDLFTFKRSKTANNNAIQVRLPQYEHAIFDFISKSFVSLAMTLPSVRENAEIFQHILQTQMV